MKKAKFLLFYFISCVFIFQINGQNNNDYNYLLQGTYYESISFESKIIDSTIRYSVYLPPQYYSKPDSFPVLFLLHGLRGDETSWANTIRIHEKTDSLIINGSIKPLILIMPAGKNSYFINDVLKHFPFDSIFIYEFYPYIFKNFKIVKDRTKCYIAGLSMGGFGAITLAAKYPDKFGKVISLSASIRTDSMIVKENDKKYNTYFAPIYGGQFKGSNRINDYWKKSNILHFLDDSMAIRLKKIQWYFNCGFNDYLLKGNEALHQLFIYYGIQHEYHVKPGNHEKKYWKAEIIEGLEFLNQNDKKK